MLATSASLRLPGAPTITSARSARTAAGSISQASSKRSTFLRGCSVPTNRK